MYSLQDSAELFFDTDSYYKDFLQWKGSDDLPNDSFFDFPEESPEEHPNLEPRGDYGEGFDGSVITSKAVLPVKREVDDSNGNEMEQWLQYCPCQYESRGEDQSDHDYSDEETKIVMHLSSHKAMDRKRAKSQSLKSNVSGAAGMGHFERVPQRPRREADQSDEDVMSTLDSRADHAGRQQLARKLRRGSYTEKPSRLSKAWACDDVGCANDARSVDEEDNAVKMEQRRHYLVIAAISLPSPVAIASTPSPSASVPQRRPQKRPWSEEDELLRESRESLQPRKRQPSSQQDYIGVKHRPDRNGKYEAYATQRCSKHKQVSISSFKTAVEGAVAHDIVALKVNQSPNTTSSIYRPRYRPRSIAKSLNQCRCQYSLDTLETIRHLSMDDLLAELRNEELREKPFHWFSIEVDRFMPHQTCSPSCDLKKLCAATAASSSES